MKGEEEVGERKSLNFLTTFHEEGEGTLISVDLKHSKKKNQTPDW